MICLGTSYKASLRRALPNQTAGDSAGRSKSPILSHLSGAAGGGSGDGERRATRMGNQGSEHV